MGIFNRVANGCVIAALLLFGLSGVPALAGQKPSAPKPKAVETATLLPQATPDLAQMWGGLDTIQRLDAVTDLIRAGALDQAEHYLTQVGASQELHRLEVVFLTGVLARSQGRTDDAVKIFRGLLTDHPSFDRVRLELGYALFQKQDDEAARHHFELVLGSTPSTDTAKSIQGLLDSMDRRRRWQFTSYFSLAPSTNLNQGTSARMITVGGYDFTIDQQARKQSGIGAYGGGAGSYAWSLSDTLDLVLGGGVQARDFRNRTYDDAVASVELGPRMRFGFGEVSLAATLARRWLGGEDHSVIAGMRSQTRMRIDQSYLMTISNSCATKAFDNHNNPTARNCSLSGSVDYVLDSHTYLRALAGIEVERTTIGALNYLEGSLGFGGFRELPWGVSLYTQVRGAERSYDAYAPGTSTSRRDRRLESSIHLTKRDLEIFSFAPSLEYTFTLNRSNLAHYSYDGHGINLTMTKRY